MSETPCRVKTYSSLTWIITTLQKSKCLCAQHQPWLSHRPAETMDRLSCSTGHSWKLLYSYDSFSIFVCCLLLEQTSKPTLQIWD